jgi:hypothetical protein
MLSHKFRIYKIGLSIFDDHPEIFRELRREVLEEVLKDHDWSKVTFMPILDSERRVFETLFSYYGKNFDAMKADEKTVAIAYRIKFNSVDEDRERKILYSFGVKTYPLIDFYLRLVKLADQLDRFFDPVAEEEFDCAFSLLYT